MHGIFEIYACAQAEQRPTLLQDEKDGVDVMGGGACLYIIEASLRASLSSFKTLACLGVLTCMIIFHDQHGL